MDELLLRLGYAGYVMGSSKKTWMFVRTPWPGKIHEHHPSFRRVSQSQKVRDGDLPMWCPQLPWSKE